MKWEIERRATVDQKLLLDVASIKGTGFQPSKLKFLIVCIHPLTSRVASHLMKEVLRGVLGNGDFHREKLCWTRKVPVRQRFVSGKITLL